MSDAVSDIASPAASAILMPRPRPDLEYEPIDATGIVEVERRLSLWERLANNTTLRRGLLLVILLLVWEGYARWNDNPMLFPRFTETFAVFWQDLLNGSLIDHTLTSMEPLLLGYGGGVILAGLLTTFAVSTRIGDDLLSTLTSMFNPLPAIAILPLALIWLGLGMPSIVFVIIHSVLWAVALNTLTGFRSVPETLRLSGRNYGLKGGRYVMLILVPAAFPSILAGLKIGWAFAWRTLIAAELVFGVSSRSGGLGWYIFEAREDMDTAKVFSGLLAVILIGLFVESVIFRAIEYRTVRRWGMQK
jgi:NitT/TauT family transport system permease protein